MGHYLSVLQTRFTRPELMCNVCGFVFHLLDHVDQLREIDITFWGLWTPALDNRTGLTIRKKIAALFLKLNLQTSLTMLYKTSIDLLK